jgi:plasmid stabilization system protein ParE
MTFPPLSVSPQAEREAHRAAQWYEKESAGLGAAFLEVVEQTLEAIEENPLRFPVVYRDVRRALLNRFPYGIFFRLRPTRLRVIAVMHLARHPSRWQTRR